MIGLMRRPGPKKKKGPPCFLEEAPLLMLHTVEGHGVLSRDTDYAPKKRGHRDKECSGCKILKFLVVWHQQTTTFPHRERKLQKISAFPWATEKKILEQLVMWITDYPRIVSTARNSLGNSEKAADYPSFICSLLSVVAQTTGKDFRTIRRLSRLPFRQQIDSPEATRSDKMGLESDATL
ncbi:hypothetical protein HNY73_013481 [Argiope bruennichi]|uniref:Uncharacterized protein n=1 Tax=Argiope bruennichi TaxID=94029 RepID=A0A8T0F463_ARGBR|nr:hypothetical protein HNY73_013481 [Argiope bruennichi]